MPNMITCSYYNTRSFSNYKSINGNLGFLSNIHNLLFMKKIIRVWAKISFEIYVLRSSERSRARRFSATLISTQLSYMIYTDFFL